MKDGITIGEQIVNRQNMRQGTISDWTKDDSGIVEHVQIRYEDGTEDWIDYGSVAKLLLETDPRPDAQQLNDNWGI